MRCCMQVSDAAASQQDHMAQAGNSTYLMESFNKLVHDLEEPLGGERPSAKTPYSRLPDPPLRLPSAACRHHSHASGLLLLCCTRLLCMHALCNAHTMSTQQAPYSVAAQTHLDSGIHDVTGLPVVVQISGGGSCSATTRALSTWHLLASACQPQESTSGRRWLASRQLASQSTHRDSTFSR